MIPAIGSGHLRRIQAAEDFSRPRAWVLHVRRSRVTIIFDLGGNKYRLVVHVIAKFDRQLSTRPLTALPDGPWHRSRCIETMR
jgi:hypothetical protein